MSKKEKTLPIPLKLVKEYGVRFPSAYSLVAKMRAEPTLQWDKEKCFIPIAATAAIAENCGKKDMYGIDQSALAALAAWREYKEIYHFDYSLAQELYLQADDMEDIPVAVLDALPYPCIYIELDNDVFQGFFVYWEQDFDVECDTHDYELRFLTVGNPDGGLAVYHLHICGDETIKDSAERTAARMKRGSTRLNLGKIADNSTLDMIADMQTQVVAKLLQLVLYICAENSDVEENPEQKQITRRAAVGTPPKDVYREIRKWDVGIKIGRLIRSQKYERAVHCEGSVKRPHVRRGHYHHYWIGSDKDGSKRLILRWVAPVFVNATGCDDIIATEYKLRK